MDDIHLRDVQHPLHLHYEQHGLHHMNNNDGLVDDEHDHRNGGIGAAGGGTEDMDGEMSLNPGNLSEHGGESRDQLTLSYQGQVYVFDSVTPLKVQTVLLLLGGHEAHEIPSGVPTVPSTAQRNNGVSVVEGLPGTVPRLNVPQRIASLIRFRAKRKERNFDKTIRYGVRKEVALRMKRNKGQFSSSKANEDSALAAASWDSNQGWSSDANGSQNQETLCLHCGISEKSTPMMRRGPDGPRTLCNACGLMWANKGTLRDLSKMPTQAGQSSLNRNENGNFDADEVATTIAENVDGSS